MSEKENKQTKKVTLWGRLLTLVVVLAIAAVLGGMGTVLWAMQPASQEQVESETFVIPRGQAISVIANRLADEGFIKHPLAFRVYVKVANLESQIQAGSFSLSPSWKLADIAVNLTQGTEDTWIVLPEGWRAEEIAAALESQEELIGFDGDSFMSLVEAEDSEGQLFPDTYLIPKTYTAEQVHTLLTTTFDRQYQQLVDDINSPILENYSFDEIVTMASLVQREAREYDQMQMVAGILWNRIEIGMLLQVDATMQYAKGYDATLDEWWSTPLAADKEIDSPFNTYQNAGLPPAPIANPGIEALRATLLPTETDNLFYLHARDGSIYFAETNEGHVRNIDRYLR